MVRFGCASVLLLGLGACGGDGGDDPATASARDVCLQITNQRRAENGKPAVVHSTELEAYADAGAAYDFHHPDPPHAHFRLDSGGGIAFAENQCPRWDVAFGGGDLAQLVGACMDAFYAEGPGGGHYENMMGDYGTLGCGLYQEGTEVTIIQDYGR